MRPALVLPETGSKGGRRAVVDKSEKFEWFVRLGYVARGVVYVLLGYLALSTAGKAQNGQSAVFDLIQDVPLGTVLLYVVALGLLAYAAYKAIDAATNLERHGDDAKGIATRVGSAASAVAHAFLAYTAYKFASGSQQAAAGSSGGQDAAASVLTYNLGAVALGLVGIGFLVGALTQAKKAWDAGFMRHVSGRAPAYVRPIGRAGHAARSVVFLLIGWSLLRSAWSESASQVKGLGEALVALSNTGLLYTLVAIGLLLFGLFSLLTAPYRIIPDIESGTGLPGRGKRRS